MLAVDRELRQNEHAVLAGVAAEAEGVIRIGGLAVGAEIAAARDTGVHGGGEVVLELDRFAAVLADGEVLGAEQLGGAAGFVVVEFVEEQDIGPNALNDFGDLAGLFVVAGFEIADKLAVGVAKERCVVRGDADRI